MNSNQLFLSLLVGACMLSVALGETSDFELIEAETLKINKCETSGTSFLCNNLFC